MGCGPARRRRAQLEQACRDVQDIEFTVERGQLYFLQTRTAKRTPRAALKIAVELVEEGLIDADEALERVAGIDLSKAVRSRALRRNGRTCRARAVASPGVACGRACFTSERASETAALGEPVDPGAARHLDRGRRGICRRRGILTAIGGRTAHAAVVAREMGKVCLVDCRALAIEEGRDVATIGAKTLREGDWIALDGATGEISLGRRAIAFERAPEDEDDMEWRKQSNRRT